MRVLRLLFLSVVIASLQADNNSRANRIRLLYEKIDRLGAQGAGKDSRHNEELMLAKYECYRDMQCNRYPEKVIKLPPVDPKFTLEIKQNWDHGPGPKIISGRVIGYPIVAQKGGYSYALGFRTGDVVICMAGVFLTETDAWKRIADRMSQAREKKERIAVDVFRGNQIVRLKMFMHPALKSPGPMPRA